MMLNQLSTHRPRGEPLCPICRKPVRLESSKTDEDGQAVHEDCYTHKLCPRPPEEPSAK